MKLQKRIAVFVSALVLAVSATVLAPAPASAQIGDGSIVRTTCGIVGSIVDSTIFQFILSDEVLEALEAYDDIICEGTFPDLGGLLPEGGLFGGLGDLLPEGGLFGGLGDGGGLLGGLGGLLSGFLDLFNLFGNR